VRKREKERRRTFREISFPAITKGANVHHQATFVTKGFDLQRTIEVSSPLTLPGHQRNSKFRRHEPHIRSEELMVSNSNEVATNTTFINLFVSIILKTRKPTRVNSFA
jgi:hypothetical protein